MENELLLICVVCGFRMTPEEAAVNEQTGQCFDCQVHGKDGRLDLMSKPDTWDAWDKRVAPEGATGRTPAKNSSIPRRVGD